MAAAPEPQSTGDAATRKLAIATKPFKGDFDQMLERRIIRVYSPYSRSLYYIDKGRERGLGAELVRDFERWVNQKYAKQLGKRPLTVYIVAATRDKLLSDLNDGVADIAIGNLTVTEERLKVVDFVAPDEKIVNVEILVTGPASPAIATIDDLSGKIVHVRKASSYYASLMALNERLKKEGKPAVNLVLVPDALEDEDMLEMMNGGLLQAMVVDDWKAKLWSQVLPKLNLHADVDPAAADQEGLGDPQEQSAARRGAERLLRELGQEAGCGRVPQAAVHEEHQDPEQSRCRRGLQAFPGGGRAIPEIRPAVQIRSIDARGTGLSGIDARPEQEKPRRRRRRDAAHAGHRQVVEGWRHQRHRIEHPWRRQVHGPADDEVLHRRQVRRAEPDIVRVREL